MPNPQKVPAEMVVRMVALQERGWPYRQIAAELKLHINTVHKYLNAHNKRVLEKLTAKGEAEKGRQVQILTRVVAEALAGWEASRKPAVTRKKTVGGEGGDKIETTVKGQSGNPSFLAEARNALEAIRKVLGIDDNDTDTSNAVALAALATALDAALAKLPADVQPIARKELAAALLEVDRDGRNQG